MKEIIFVLLMLGLFIFFIYFLIPRKSKKKEVKKEATPKKEDASEKEEIPQILKEITMGNYMHDVSVSIDDNSEGIQMEENSSIEKEPLDDFQKIEQAFDDIDDVSIDVDMEFDEVDDSEIDIDEEADIINDYYSDVLENNNSKIKTKGQSIADEYKGLSKDMKTLIIANILAKKNK